MFYYSWDGQIQAKHIMSDQRNQVQQIVQSKELHLIHTGPIPIVSTPSGITTFVESSNNSIDLNYSQFRITSCLILFLKYHINNIHFDKIIILLLMPLIALLHLLSIHYLLQDFVFYAVYLKFSMEFFFVLFYALLMGF